MMNFKRFTAGLLVIALTFSVFCINVLAVDTQTQTNEQTQTEAQTQKQENSINTDYLKSVMKLIKQKYNGNITDEDLNTSIVRGMFGSMDQYTMFFNQEEYNSFYGSLEGSVVGIGISAQLIDDYVNIMKVYNDSPAKKAGILPGDKIAQVNGESVAGKQIEDVTSKIKGPAGTTVKLGILRQGVKNIITLEIERALVPVPSVIYEVRGDIGYILVLSFSENTYNEMAKALEFLDSKKITKVVLDLRNNTGGYVDQAVEVAKFFVPKGLITKLDYKDASMQDESYYSILEKTKYKLAVLVNEYSASASEILTGAIKDTKSGVVIGTKTFGKAKVQNSYPILTPEAYERLNKDNENKSVSANDFSNVYVKDILGYSKMTIGMYYTPSGECIDLKGIEPNIKFDKNKSEDSLFISLIEPLSMSVKPSLGTKYMDVYYAECILKLLKYNVDTPDYTMDKKTFAAIKKFQKDNKIYSYGVIDFYTQKLLNEKLETLKQTKDAVYAKAVVELKK